MRYYFVLCLILLTSCQHKKAFQKAPLIASRIDSLSTEPQIEEYIQTLDTNLRDFHLVDYSKIMTYNHSSYNIDSITRTYAKELGINKTFYKTDFNNDGYTDLLMIGGWNNSGDTLGEYQFNSQVVINGVEKKSSTFSIAREYNFGFVPQIVETDSLPFLILHHPRKLHPTSQTPPDSTQIKLIYYLNNFVEFNPKHVKHHKIQKIEFASGSSETQPVFQMILNDKNESWFRASINNFVKGSEYNGSFKTHIIKADFQELCELLNYVDFENIPSYGIASGYPAEAIKIIYDDGKVKEIYTYDWSKTYGLQAVFNKIEQLRLSQNWLHSNKSIKITLHKPEQRLKWKA